MYVYVMYVHVRLYISKHNQHAIIDRFVYTCIHRLIGERMVCEACSVDERVQCASNNRSFLLLLTCLLYVNVYVYISYMCIKIVYVIINFY